MVTEMDGSGRPNVILVVVDDQGYGDLGCHGHPAVRTPNIDDLASQSVRFTDFHSAPMCTPTRGSLMTGLDALRHRAVNVSSGRTLMRTDVTTLPEVLKVFGYRTSLIGKWHLGDNYPYRPVDRGFSHSRWFPSSHVMSAPDRWENDYFDTWLRDERSRTMRHHGYCTDILFGLAFDEIRDAYDSNTPFFTYLSLNVLHHPHLVPDEYREPYRHMGHDLASYFGMIANLDLNMGRLDALLRELSLWEDTIVIYMSDNGAAPDTAKFYNAGMRGAKSDLWEGGHRVPLFLRWPGGGVGGVDGGRSTDALAVVQDLMPTLIDLCGVDESVPVDGVDLAPIIRGADLDLTDRMAVIQYSRMESPRPTRGDGVVLWGKWRLVGDGQLFNISSDPEEREDVAPEYPDVVDRMRSHYAAWWDGVAEYTASHLPLVVGAEAENPCLLSPADWHDVFLDQQVQIRDGLRRSGVWGVQAVRTGRYLIGLCRWPREANLTITSPAPAFVGGDCVYPAGVALPIAQACVRIGDSTTLVKPVIPLETEVDFDLLLNCGNTTIEAWFEDADGDRICGAYYAYVEYLDDAR